jgi:hypothetical protein
MMDAPNGQFQSMVARHFRTLAAKHGLVERRNWQKPKHVQIGYANESVCIVWGYEPYEDFVTVYLGRPDDLEGATEKYGIPTTGMRYLWPVLNTSFPNLFQDSQRLPVNERLEFWVQAYVRLLDKFETSLLGHPAGEM